ncbi:hypothetical protein CFOL_v3_02525 [Cephalotus follicularis]|uniref:Uncharacterized protein n=1 Tax=Cephalotus follicularis TaxID=3775 RepID=A0A1Q3ATU2_CEPFO|nr:hypothetical protein CFOL_v3_02525 [Cephalotus follicularis]
MAITTRSSSTLQTLSKTTLRFFSTKNNHQQTHEFLGPNPFLGSWEKPKDPRDAERRVAQLRREYGKQVKEVRKQYIQEVELMLLDKQRKDEARREAIRVANEERKKLKAEAAKVKAELRMVAQQEFKQVLLKERAEKLENWRMKENTREEKKKEKKELLRRQSSMWVNEHELEKKILEVVVDITHL